MAQRYVELQWHDRDLQRLQEEVSDGVYAFDRPLMLTSVAWQDSKFVCYPSCAKCTKRVTVCPDGGYVCNTHKWQRFPPTYRFATRMLLVDWNGGQLWTTTFNEIMKGLLGDLMRILLWRLSEMMTAAKLCPPCSIPPLEWRRLTKGGYTKTLEVVQKRAMEECVLNAGW